MKLAGTKPKGSFLPYWAYNKMKSPVEALITLVLPRIRPCKVDKMQAIVYYKKAYFGMGGKSRQVYFIETIHKIETNARRNLIKRVSQPPGI
ncbi:MAG: hypothetical protein KBA53_03455 [Thermoclostridium sp.]|nr:hypothetical protein [Thermoclostridium sp.]